MGLTQADEARTGAVSVNGAFSIAEEEQGPQKPEEQPQLHSESSQCRAGEAAAVVLTMMDGGGGGISSNSNVSAENSVSFAVGNGGKTENGGEQNLGLAGNGGEELPPKDADQRPEEQRDDRPHHALQSEPATEGQAVQAEPIKDTGTPISDPIAPAHGNEVPSSSSQPSSIESGGGGGGVVAHRSPIFGELDENSARQLLTDSGWNVSQSLRRGGQTQWYYRTPPPKTTLLGSLASAVAMWKKMMDEEHKRRGGGDEDAYPMVTAFLNNCKAKKPAPRKRKRAAARVRA